MELDLDRIQRLAEEFENDPNLPGWTEEQLHIMRVLLNVRPPGSFGDE